MKKLSILTIAPVLALIGVSCSGPTAMQATEYDDLYYSSADRARDAQQQEALASTRSYEVAAPARSNETAPPAREEQVLSEGEVLNPEYSSESAVSTENYEGDEYYDGRRYNPRDNWYRPNYSYIDPAWANAVYDPWYPGYSRYGGYGRYYDPFYDPFMYDSYYRPYRPYYGSAFTISIGLSYGWGNWYPYRPYGYGCWSCHPYYGYGYGYGGYGGYYGHNYWYDRPVVHSRKVQYGPREDRATVPTTGVVGRPNRRQDQSVQQQQDAVNPANTTNRPARPARGNTRTDIVPGTNTREALPATPNPTGSPNYRRSERNINRQRVNEQPAIQQQQQPVQRREVRPAQPQERAPRRMRESVPSRESSQPIRQQRNIESRPSYEQPRRESSSPSYEPRRESSSPAPSNNSGGGGRPRRGQ
ncbi:hypothetical protein [Pontibacter ruber]|uniref:Prolyl-tRNA synthetase n=1 Tax=Pontibacter ruber TaxID=1343895 RepID=A0ABW5CXP2_9BACT|nr:hypothetical protein [Pontibacter ruber]